MPSVSPTRRLMAALSELGVDRRRERGVQRLPLHEILPAPRAGRRVSASAPRTASCARDRQAAEARDWRRRWPVRPEPPAGHTGVALASMKAGATLPPRPGIAFNQAADSRHLLAQCRFTDRDRVDRQVLAATGGRSPDNEETGRVDADLIRQHHGAGVERLLHLGQVERRRILQCGKPGRRRANAGDDLALLLAHFAQVLLESVDLVAILPGIEPGERFLQAVVLFAKLRESSVSNPARGRRRARYPAPPASSGARAPAIARAPRRRVPAARGGPARRRTRDRWRGAVRHRRCAPRWSRRDAVLCDSTASSDAAKLAAAVSRSPRSRARRPSRRKMNAWVALSGASWALRATARVASASASVDLPLAFGNRGESIEHVRHLEAIRSCLLEQDSSGFEALAGGLEVAATEGQLPEVVERDGHCRTTRALPLLENQRPLQEAVSRVVVAPLSRRGSRAPPMCSRSRRLQAPSVP